VLPKSNREAAHSPPRHRTKVPISTSPPVAIEPSISSSLPKSQSIESSPPSKLTQESTLITNDKPDSLVNPEKTNPKMIKQRSLSTKTIYRSGSGMTISRSSEQTDSTDLNSNSAPRMFIHSLFLQTISNILL
jgi:hypothetical protein